MIKLNLPEYTHNIKIRNSNPEIFDPIRKKYVKLTPEEWVRQNFTAFLIHHKNYPSQLIAIEKSIVLNTMNVRPDIVIYENDGQALLIVECKAPTVQINQESFDQIAKYNYKLKVKYLAVTNGMEHFFCKMDYLQNSYSFIPDLPDFDEAKK